MLEQIIYALPLLILFGGILYFSLFEFRDNEVLFTFRTTRLTLLLSFVFTIIFYNKPMINGLMRANMYSMFFQVLLYGSAIILLYMSRKWFAVMKESTHMFCYALLLSVFAGNILITSRNLALTLGSFLLLMLSSLLFLQKVAYKKENAINVKIYAISAIIGSTFLLIATIFLFEKSGSLDYGWIKLYLDQHGSNIMVFGAISVFILAFMFLLGMAPLHFWFTEISGRVTLPVFGYFTLVPLGAVWAGFIRFHLDVSAPIADFFKLFYVAIGLTSITVGAIGACSGKNMRKLLAYSAVFHQGVMFLLLQYFTLQSASAAFEYLLIYLLAAWGANICLFGLKIRGEYLFTFDEFAGIVYKRPYIAAVFTVVLFSMLGFPPLAGFWGIFWVTEVLVYQGNFYQMLYLIVMLMCLGFAYLQAIQTFYFENSHEILDRSDRGTYVGLTFFIIVMILMMCFPHYWIENFNFIAEGVR